MHMSKRGFSTLEIMIAFAILAIVLSGVILADFGAQYWTITSQTSNEALYKAKIGLENLRAASKRDFLSATSTAYAPSDGSCAPNSLCYWLQTNVTDISACSKYASSTISWQVSGYPTTTTTLFTTFSDTQGVILRGGDCGLNWPSGDWTNPQSVGSTNLTGIPSSIDALNGATYVGETSAPYLEAVKDGSVYGCPASICSDPLNAIDVARNLNPNQPFTYAYAAASSTTDQLQIYDVSDPTNIFRAAALTLMPSGSYPQGWKLTFYDRSIYILTKETSGPELHIVDVRTPTSPAELGSGTELGFTATDIIVRDQYSGGVKKRFAYLTAMLDHREIQVFDVTDPLNVTFVAKADLDPQNVCTGTLPDARTLTLSGTVLYVGTDYRTTSPCSQLPELYAFDVTDPAQGIPQIGSMEVGADVLSLRVSGPYLFLPANHSGIYELQVRNSDPSNLALLNSIPVSAKNIGDGIDFDNDVTHASDSDTGYLYLLNGSKVQTFSSTPTL